MWKVSKFQLLKFSIYFIILSLITISFIIEHGFRNAIHITFLLWSFLIICIPSNHGKTLLAKPIKIITGKNLIYPEIFMWSGAILLNIFTYFITPQTYLLTFSTHLLLKIISNPWPYWAIIFFCSLGTLYKFFIGSNSFYSKKLLHYTLRFFFSISGIIMFLYFSYNELVILLNVRA
ncbi:hypothetical protein KAT08_00015 [Candidatus Babeliales bacterium]|nr:hypothetical protein [Candidatus Babeliales bacterium]